MGADIERHEYAGTGPRCADCFMSRDHSIHGQPAGGYHVIRVSTDNGRVCTTRTYASDGMAARESRAWNQAGGWTAKVMPGPAPKAACGKRFCAVVSGGCVHKPRERTA